MMIDGNDKKVVHYDAESGVHHLANNTAMLKHIDHPDSDRVSNDSFVMTSKVLNWDEDSGIIETLNTIYIPMETENDDDS